MSAVLTTRPTINMIVGQRRNSPPCIGFGERPLIAVLTIGRADFDAARRGRVVSVDGDLNVGMFAKSRIRRENQIDVPVAQSVPALPRHIIAGVGLGVIGIGHHPIVRPHRLEAVHVLLDDRFTFGIDELTNRFFVGSGDGRRRALNRSAARRISRRRGRGLITSYNNHEQYAERERDFSRETDIKHTCFLSPFSISAEVMRG